MRPLCGREVRLSLPAFGVHDALRSALRLEAVLVEVREDPALRLPVPIHLRRSLPRYCILPELR